MAKRRVIGVNPRTGQVYYERIPDVQYRIEEKARTIDDLRMLVRRSHRELKETFVNAVWSAEPYIIKAVVQNQMYLRGVDGYNKKIQPPYAKSTIRKKKAKMQPYDRVTLRDTGEYHASMHLEMDEGSNRFYVLPDEDIPYVQHIENRYGVDQYYITQGNQTEILKKYIKPQLVKMVRAQFGLV